ncbi:MULTISPECIES: ABC transporter permease [unclassified Pseudodesulfovibrio]|uniref:ABC transporter permease n=1 Tax=unclassified Pseudodesulfovibrio TaxID=2661612 RepID=UPI000FEBF820|nr:MULTISPECIES: ABC transporter permease [unclassified Pseudodesulfovibrio]MCJ2164717.1 ABC transporter permease [Pseudodesulfovibrio sp. S3-i]RWU04094.1 ABC transporter permease [Pseudodesulfovibrio sp. S3]
MTVKLESLFWLAVKQYFESRVAALGLVALVAIIAVALLAPYISPQNPYDLMTIDVMDSKLTPGTKSMDESITYVLGTDSQGRDMLSSILYGLRISLGVGVVSTIIALIIGSIIGLWAAYKGGKIDSFIMRTVDLQLSFPAILVALILLAILGKGIDKIVLALVIVQWAYYARAIRSNVLVERNKEYVEAAKCLALPQRRIMFGHVLPNCMPELIVISTVKVAGAIALEATLSFLGLGMPITKPSLGLLIANGFKFLQSGYYWISVYPGVALLILIVCINLVGDRLRDVLNPRMKR